MISIEYRWTANRDIYRIRTYYEGISEKTWKTVSDDIQDSLSFLQRSPKGGMKLSSKGKVRRTVTSKYNYSITYIPHPTKIEIIGVFRGQDRRV